MAWLKPQRTTKSNSILAAQTVTELATVAKHTKPRKGGRRGKRKMEDPNYAYNEALQAVEAHDAEGDGDAEEDHDAVLDDEVAKKKQAIDKLAEIEKKFKLFRSVTSKWPSSNGKWRCSGSQIAFIQNTLPWSSV
ncbi:predicted protein [Plenodomus lingam JN3]|uniref:Predicted protein n=1 Tax=Leptosphaeria maculans (strain JN3 / isolate v23.1.3 / race Av1-4-5-6-7-8) TaxID=985895 RepID=E4ZVQ5_LEPMJ|nr:predicted protein [Plenodomus lingam JN3]CBX95681.1 predicted protein [Plenodomus lingam JN3]